MTEREFRRGIARAKRNINGEYDTRGVCVVLHEEFHEFELFRAAFFSRLFSDLFSPEVNSSGYWLGTRFKLPDGSNNHGNLDRRRLFLNIFEEYVAVNQYYLAA